MKMLKLGRSFSRGVALCLLGTVLFNNSFVCVLADEKKENQQITQEEKIETENQEAVAEDAAGQETTEQKNPAIESDKQETAEQKNPAIESDKQETVEQKKEEKLEDAEQTQAEKEAVEKDEKKPVEKNGPKESRGNDYYFSTTIKNGSGDDYTWMQDDEHVWYSKEIYKGKNLLISYKGKSTHEIKNPELITVDYKGNKMKVTPISPSYSSSEKKTDNDEIYYDNTFAFQIDTNKEGTSFYRMEFSLNGESYSTEKSVVRIDNTAPVLNLEYKSEDQSFAPYYANDVEVVAQITEKNLETGSLKISTTAQYIDQRIMEDATDGEAMLYGASRAAGAMIPGVAIGIASGGSGTAAVVGTAVTGGVYGTSAGGNAKAQMEQAGYTEQAAVEYGVAVGIEEGVKTAAMSQIGKIGANGGNIPLLDGAAAAGVSTAGYEFVDETLIRPTIDYTILDDKDAYKNVDYEQAFHNAEIAGVTTAVMYLGFGAYGKYKNGGTTTEAPVEKIPENEIIPENTNIESEVTLNEPKQFKGQNAYEFYKQEYGADKVCWESVDPVKAAEGWQGDYPYVGVDKYKATTLQPGDTIYMGEPYPTGYSTTFEDIAALNGDASKIFKGLQVKPYYQDGMEFASYRGEMTPYRVNEPINVAEGITNANPQFGEGGLRQRFDPNFEYNTASGRLTPIREGTIHLNNTEVPLDEYFGMMDNVGKVEAGALENKGNSISNATGASSLDDISTKPFTKTKWWHNNYVNNLSDLQTILGIKQSEKGLSTLGSMTRENAINTGKSWVGEDYKTITGKNGNIIGYASKDGMRAFRIQYKPREGMWRANFQENMLVNNRYPNVGEHVAELRNVHVDIID